MSKVINIKYNDKDYTLEYTRKSVETMENRGFKANEITDKPLTTLPLLFAGAFLAHHRDLSTKIIEEIFKSMPNKDDLIPVLVEMYNDPILSMLDSAEENGKNATWATNW